MACFELGDPCSFSLQFWVRVGPSFAYGDGSNFQSSMRTDGWKYREFRL